MGGDIAEIQLRSERELNKYINHYVCSSSKIILLIVHVYIIFALPDYSSSDAIERHQNLFYRRFIHLALEFDIH